MAAVEEAMPGEMKKRVYDPRGGPVEICGPPPHTNLEEALPTFQQDEVNT